MILQDILTAKGTHVFTIHPDATLDHVAHDMVKHNVGALVVCTRECPGGERLAGIVTERDLLRVWAAGQSDLAAVKVHTVMTTKLITATPESPVEDVMGLMTDHRIRHLPVLAEGRLVGIVSIGDVVKAQHDRLAMENRFMRSFIVS